MVAIEMDKENDLIFHEVQRFCLWIRLPLVLLTVLVVVIQVFALKTTILKQEAPDLVPVILLIAAGIGLPIAIAVLLLTVKLETAVRSDGLYVRFFPIHMRYKKFTAEDLSEYYARTYKPIVEYGGWGIRYSFVKSGKAYNVSGNKGVQLVLKNGRKLLIGSQKPDELAAAIRLIMEST